MKYTEHATGELVRYGHEMEKRGYSRTTSNVLKRLPHGLPVTQIGSIPYADRGMLDAWFRDVAVGKVRISPEDFQRVHDAARPRQIDVLS